MASFEDNRLVLQAAFDAGSIKNTDYQRLKQDFNWALERADREAQQHAPRIDYQNASALLKALDDYMPMLHTLTKADQKFQDLDHPTAVARRAGWHPFLQPAQQLQALKDHVVKRAPSAAIDVGAKYRAPQAGREAIFHIKARLEEITQSAYQELLDFFVARFQRFQALYLDHAEIAKAQGRRHSPYDLWGRRDQTPYWPEACDCLSQLVEQRQKTYILKARAPDLLQAMAERIAANTRDHFVYKNLEKIDSILDAKGGFDRVEVLGRRVDLGGLEGSLRVFFTDGSAFSVRNSVVWNVSVHGKPFQQFPLRFFDVRMPDGSMLSTPSEERMNLIFCKTT